MEENDLDKEVEELPELPAEPAEGEDDTTDWKAEALKRQGIAKRYKTKLEKSKEVKKAEAVIPEKVEKEGFDYAEKAFLTAKDINSDEYDFVQEVMLSTGKSLEEVLEAKYFQAELKERRDLKASKDAIPSGSRRSVSSARDSVEYWLAKDELPPYEQKELREQVVNAKIKKEQDKTHFTDNPIV